jgi:hypothetical protein
VIETALVHVISNQVEAAYRRGDLFQKRRTLMDAWSAFCGIDPTEGGKVLPLRVHRPPKCRGSLARFLLLIGTAGLLRAGAPTVRHMRSKPGRPTRTTTKTTKVALITGAGRGIGRATAAAFAASGYAVVLAELRPNLGRATERALTRAGHAAFFQQTDVSDASSVAACIAATLRRFGRIGCLVNNAGVGRIGPLATLPVRDLDRMLNVNLRGPLLVAKTVLPTMLQQRAGVIINVASLLGKEGAGEYVTYCATKFGVVGLTEHWPTSSPTPT